MCLSVPMRIEEIAGHRARCAALGQERWADLMLMGDQPPEVGDYVVIELGFIQRIVPESEALESHELFREITRVLDAETQDRAG
ncbi:HypC/HybG/HupF family hydrogenase formation chaperone [Marimonas arenosa]|uniref:HypC/HybG/HupF family hydrogenase formation chaperone n=1 Tax=Marimonas arenosa TaxID=1795305 RepID=A0AAE3WBM8_9RHOB|nr:HypC/HybG/HupF family hydrogenase formation chaperone [Marimonas arenosa]MDQ2089724.1 HypC/HybG/HupF family hydrogenase formation chaperone [Marimonas arenosa]